MPTAKAVVTEVPWRVYAKGSYARQPQWWLYDSTSGKFFTYSQAGGLTAITPNFLRIADHPKNDPEAIAKIEAASPQELSK